MERLCLVLLLQTPLAYIQDDRQPPAPRPQPHLTVHYQALGEFWLLQAAEEMGSCGLQLMKRSFQALLWPVAAFSGSRMNYRETSQEESPVAAPYGSRLSHSQRLLGLSPKSAKAAQPQVSQRSGRSPWSIEPWSPVALGHDQLERQSGSLFHRHAYRASLVQRL